MLAEPGQRPRPQTPLTHTARGVAGLLHTGSEGGLTSHRENGLPPPPGAEPMACLKGGEMPQRHTVTWEPATEGSEPPGL